MCEIDWDDDSRCTVLADREHTARTAHRCSSCGGPIAPGERYRAVMLVGMDGAAHEKACARCQSDLRAFEREHHIWLAPSAFDFALEDCINQEPESRARWGPVRDTIVARNRAARQAAPPCLSPPASKEKGDAK